MAEKVSERATKNPREFVGEVFAQLMTGQPVDARTLNLYRKFQGVEPR